MNKLRRIQSRGEPLEGNFDRHWTSDWTINPGGWHRYPRNFMARNDWQIWSPRKYNTLGDVVLLISSISRWNCISYRIYIPSALLVMSNKRALSLRCKSIKKKLMRWGTHSSFPSSMQIIHLSISGWDSVDWTSPFFSSLHSKLSPASKPIPS